MKAHESSCQGAIPSDVDDHQDELEYMCSEAVHVHHYWSRLEDVASTYYPNATLGCCQEIVKCCDAMATTREGMNVVFNGCAAIFLMVVVLHSTWLLMSLPAIGAHRARTGEGELLVKHFRYHFFALQAEFVMGIILAFAGITIVCQIKVRYHAISFGVGLMGPIGVGVNLLLGATIVSTIARTRSLLGRQRYERTGISDRQARLEKLWGATNQTQSMKERLDKRVSMHARRQSKRGAPLKPRQEPRASFAPRGSLNNVHQTCGSSGGAMPFGQRARISVRPSLQHRQHTSRLLNNGHI